MKIQKIPNKERSYNYIFTENNKQLIISFEGNLDLYMTLRDGNNLSEKENRTITFEITKEDHELFYIFDSLYKDIIEGKVFNETLEFKSSIDYKKTYEYKKLVNDKMDITWISDNGPSEIEDRVIISPLNEDVYRLTFVRNGKTIRGEIKSHFGISVRFRNSGSQYDPFNCVFMRMFRKLQQIDPEYHQIHFEEIEYFNNKQKVYKPINKRY